jgi:hypothetical protein
MQFLCNVKLNDMSNETIQQIATVTDLAALRKHIVNDVAQLIKGKEPQKLFYTPKEFAHITGMKYSTVIAKCKDGRLKARQEAPGCSWLISASELERLNEETI